MAAPHPDPTAETANETLDEYLAHAPSGPLAELVHGYTGYRQRGVAPAEHTGLPSPDLTVIFTFDEPLHVVRHADPHQAADTYRGLVGGLHTAPAVIRHDGAQAGVQVQLDPLAARRLLGVPAAELASLDVHAADVLGRAADDISDRLAEADGWAARFEVVEAALLAALDRHGHAETPPEIRHAWRRVRETGGRCTVAGLSREVGWSERYLSTRFRAETGLSPKAGARVVRFDQVRRRLQAMHARGETRSGASTLAALAAEHGYFDQSHLDRDFVAFAGRAPTHWLDAEFGSHTANPQEI